MARDLSSFRPVQALRTLYVRVDTYCSQLNAHIDTPEGIRGLGDTADRWRSQLQDTAEQAIQRPLNGPAAGRSHNGQTAERPLNGQAAERPHNGQANGNGATRRR